jgi:hypothetical protein
MKMPALPIIPIKTYRDAEYLSPDKYYGLY